MDTGRGFSTSIQSYYQSIVRFSDKKLIRIIRVDFRDKNFELFVHTIKRKSYFLKKRHQKLSLMSDNNIIDIRSSPQKLIQEQYRKQSRYSPLSVFQDDVPDIIIISKNNCLYDLSLYKVWLKQHFLTIFIYDVVHILYPPFKIRYFLDDVIHFPRIIVFHFCSFYFLTQLPRHNFSNHFFFLFLQEQIFHCSSCITCVGEHVFFKN